MKALNVYDYLVVVVYMVMMVGIGLYFFKYIKDSGDYFRAGNKLSWWIAALSAFMSSFSAYMFTGGAGVIYQEGLTGTVILGFTGLAISSGYFLFAGLWRRSRVTTILEFLDERFNLTSHQVASWTYVPFNILYCAVALYSLAIFIASSLGLDIFSVIWICGVVIMAYTLFGGVWAVSVTDTVQFLVLLPVCLLLIPLSLAQIGSLSDFFSSMPEGYFSVPSQQHPWYWLAALFLLLVHGQNTNPIAQRYFSVRDEAEARKVSLMCSLLFIAGIMFWTIPPMVVRYLYPDLSLLVNLPNPHEGAYVVIALRVLPHGLIGLMIAAIFAAAMSAIDSQYNVISGVITKDIIQKLFKGDLDERKLLRIGQLATLAVGLIVISLSLEMAKSGQGSFKTMMKLSSLTGTPLATPLLLGFLFRKAPGWSYAFSFACSGFVALLCAFFPPVTGYLAVLGSAMEFTLTTFAIFFAGLGAFFISPLVFKSSPAEKQRIGNFFAKLGTPVDADSEIAESEIDKAPMARLVGLMSIILGAVIAIFVFIPATLSERLINLCLGLVLGAFGWLIFSCGKKGKP
jgi:SSS family solute:Na+ symporter